MRNRLTAFPALFTALVIFVCCLSGCTQKPESDDIYRNADGFEAVLTVVSGDTTFKFSVSRLKPDYFELNFTEPPLLQNFVLIFTGGEAKLKYYGFELSLNRFPLPVTGGIGKIVDALAALDNGFEKLNLMSDEGRLVYGGNGFTVAVSPDSLLPLSFEVESDGGTYYITVDSFRLLNGSTDSQTGNLSSEQ